MKKWDESERQARLQQQRNSAASMEELFGEKQLKAAPRRTNRGHVHAEAFCLMGYVCTGRVDPSQTFRSNDGRLLRTPGCGHRETFWNSRDGVTPFGMGCPSCGGDLQHMNWGADTYAPDHKPHHGQGIWRDGTPDEAEAFIRYRVAKYPDGLTPEYIEGMVAVVRDPDNEQNTEFRRGWPMFERHDVTKASP